MQTQANTLYRLLTLTNNIYDLGGKQKIKNGVERWREINYREKGVKCQRKKL